MTNINLSATLCFLGVVQAATGKRKRNAIEIASTVSEFIVLSDNKIQKKR